MKINPMNENYVELEINVKESLNTMSLIRRRIYDARYKRLFDRRNEQMIVTPSEFLNLKIAMRQMQMIEDERLRGLTGIMIDGVQIIPVYDGIVIDEGDCAKFAYQELKEKGEKQ